MTYDAQGGPVPCIHHDWEKSYVTVMKSAVQNTKLLPLG